jgi:GTPase KRas
MDPWVSGAVHICPPPLSRTETDDPVLRLPLPTPVSFLSRSRSPDYWRSSDGRYDPTIEDSYSVTRTIDGLPYFLSLTDTAGQEEYRGLWAASNLQSDAFLLVYDITNASSLDALDYFMDMIDIEEETRLEENNNAELRGVKGGKDIKAPPVKIVAGNKCDLKDSRVVSSRTGLEWARKRRCGFMETSAREMVNIEETFACKCHLPLPYEQ